MTFFGHWGKIQFEMLLEFERNFVQEVPCSYSIFVDGHIQITVAMG